MRKRPAGRAAHPQRLLLAVVCLLGAGACWRGDLPSLATRSTVDAARVQDSGPAPGVDAAVIVVTQGDPNDAGQDTPEIALILSMPVDTDTGQLVEIGTVSIKLTTGDPASAHLVTLEIGQPRQQVRINLSDVPTGGPYTVEISASAGGVACATSTLPFSVSEGQTVTAFLALLCGGDAGWSSTL